MALVERDIVIGNDIETVFNYAGAADYLPEWFEGIVSVQADGVWPGEGGQIGVVYNVMGVDLEMTATVTVYNPPYEFAFDLAGMVNATSRWVYEDDGGNTRVYAAFDYNLPGGVLGQIADKVAFEGRMIEKGERSLVNLKSIAEG